MKDVGKLMLTAALCLGITACATREPAQTEAPEPVDTERPVYEPPETSAAPDPSDFTNPDNLVNPESLLSKRVIYFDFDQSTIRPEFRDVLAAHGRFLASNPSYEATLEGHADERGTREYNLGLGERRANAVSDVLDVQGAASNQLEEVSYGEERPVATCSQERCWSRNRRVEIVYTSS